MSGPTRDEDRRQAVRMRRFRQAAAASLLVVALLALAHALGVLDRAGLVYGTGMILFWIALFYALFRSGLNRRAGDPSLTVPMILAAVLTTVFVMYLARDAHGALMPVLLMGMFFGALRLDTRRLAAIATVAFVAYGVMLWRIAAVSPRPLDPRLELFQLAVLAVALAWFAYMGGYINALRRRMRRSNEELAAALVRIERMAARDELTGLCNRRHLMSVLEREKARSDRGQGSFCIGLLDIDHFKRVNDSCGHPAGDEVLRCIARAVEDELRRIDTAARYGGEEFGIVFAQTSEEGALQGADRIRRRIEALRIPALPQAGVVTASIGVTEFRSGEPLEAAIGRADAALYRAKQQGRNRVEAG
jgi:diguanylate cyclase (GGDEF)-like protein